MIHQSKHAIGHHHDPGPTDDRYTGGGTIIPRQERSRIMAFAFRISTQKVVRQKAVNELGTILSEWDWDEKGKTNFLDSANALRLRITDSLLSDELEKYSRLPLRVSLAILGITNSKIYVLRRGAFQILAEKTEVKPAETIQYDEPSGGMSERKRQEIEKYGIDRIATTGVHDEEFASSDLVTFEDTDEGFLNNEVPSGTTQIIAASPREDRSQLAQCSIWVRWWL